MPTADFPQRLDLYLREHAISEAKLAKKLGVKQATVNRWRRRGNRPAGTPAIKLARMLRMPLDEVVRGPRRSQSDAPAPTAEPDVAA